MGNPEIDNFDDSIFGSDAPKPASAPVQHVQRPSSAPAAPVVNHQPVQHQPVQHKPVEQPVQPQTMQPQTAQVSVPHHPAPPVSAEVPTVQHQPVQHQPVQHQPVQQPAPVAATCAAACCQVLAQPVVTAPTQVAPEPSQVLREAIVGQGSALLAKVRSRKTRSAAPLTPADRYSRRRRFAAVMVIGAGLWVFGTWMSNTNNQLNTSQSAVLPQGASQVAMPTSHDTVQAQAILHREHASTQIHRLSNASLKTYRPSGGIFMAYSGSKVVLVTLIHGHCFALYGVDAQARVDHVPHACTTEGVAYELQRLKQAY
jgi:hypothetical protein